MIKLVLSIVCLSLFVNAEAIDDVGIIKIFKRGEITNISQLTSNNWGNTDLQNACIISENKKFVALDPVVTEEMTCDGGRYMKRSWNINGDIDNGYFLVQEIQDNCSNSFMIKPPKEYDLVASEVRYIDIEKIQLKFSAEIFQKMYELGANSKDMPHVKDVIYALSRAKLKVVEYDYFPENLKLHYSQLIIEKRVKGVKIEIPIADYWVQLHSVKSPTILSNRNFFNNFLDATNSDSSVEIERNISGPFFNRSYLYFIENRDLGQSRKLELFRYHIYDEKPTKKVLSTWTEGC